MAPNNSNNLTTPASDNVPPPTTPEKNMSSSSNTGYQPFSFEPYGPDEVHPSKTFNDKLKALSSYLTHNVPTNEPLDFAPGERPPIIIVKQHQRVGTQDDPIRANQGGSGVSTTAPTSDVPTFATAKTDVASPSAAMGHDAAPSAHSGVIADTTDEIAREGTTTSTGPMAASRSHSAASNDNSRRDLGSSARRA